MLVDRFWSKVDKTETCWLWTGSQNGVGYGELRFGKKKHYAHRLSYADKWGVIPAGFQIDHLCRVRSCVNPDHLEAVTPKVNVGRGNAAKPKPQMMKTHCNKGHEYTPENSYVRKDGKGRNCNECVRIRAREYARRKHGYKTTRR